MKNRKLIISCGGTGGHFFPGLAIARILKESGGEALLLLSGVNAAKQRREAADFGIEAIELSPMPSPGRNPLKCLKFGLGLASGFLRSNREMKIFRPDAVLGMGSFASLPVLFAGRFRKIPLYLHDGNARIGRANRFLSRYARFLGTAFPAVNADRIATSCRCRCTGMPLRPELLNARRYSREEALHELNRNFQSRLVPERKTILVVGGSQGAAALNAGIPAALLKLLPDDLQVIHLAGPGKIKEVEKTYEQAPFPVLALPFCAAMELPYSAADLVISRSGGSTVAELAFFGKAAILIPYPHAAENHQWDNARFLVKNQAAIAIDNADCTVNKIMELIVSFLDNPDQWEQRAANAARLARPEAAQELLRHIFPTG